MLKKLSKIPLFLGLTVLVISVLVSVVQIGSSNSITKTGIKASQSEAFLSLRYSNPDLMTVSLVTDKNIAGIDIMLKYDKSKFSIMPSTLSAKEDYITSGGVNDEENGIFRFSVLPKNSTFISSGIISTFNVTVKNNTIIEISDIVFDVENDNTAVYDSGNMDNILKKTEFIKN